MWTCHVRPLPSLQAPATGTDIENLVLMGQVAAIIKDIKPARQIVEDMVREAVAQLKTGQSYLQEGGKSRL